MTSTTLAVAWVAAGRGDGYASDGLFVGNVHYAPGQRSAARLEAWSPTLLGSAWKVAAGLIVASDEETHQRLVDIIHPYLADALSITS